MNVQPVILCGGSGTRLWPLSRENHPKQLLALGGGSHTMLQATALRFSDNSRTASGNLWLPPIVVANEEYRFISAEQLRQVDVKAEALLLEPFGRNTAPALTLAALYARSRGRDPVFVVMPADHVIQNVEAFRQAALTGVPYAERGQFVTFGVKPLMPHTGYGYIRAKGQGGPMPVTEFVEKPDADTARGYVASGDYFWNSGVFMMKASGWLREISRWRPDISQACEDAVTNGEIDRDFLRVNREAFAACPSESIDYAVMEPLAALGAADSRAIVIPLDAQWSDIGAWEQIWDISPKDAQANAIRGDVRTVDTQESLIIAESRLVACVGLSGVVVVETPDAVLVADRAHIEQVKALVAGLKVEGRPEPATHRKVYRPWGWYDSIDAGPRFQAKRIVVNPGAKLSLQLHHHRAEHWIVVVGTARVTRGDEVFILSENQSTYIPLGVKHRLENPGKVPLEMIEVQSGAYLGEDDIIRLEDTYGRQ